MRLALPEFVLWAACTAIAASPAAGETPADTLAKAAPPDSLVRRLPPDSLNAAAFNEVRSPGLPDAVRFDLNCRALRLDGPITLDGALSEPVWRTAPPATRFLQRDPYEGAPATERTEVRMAYDDEAIYIGARLYDSHPDSIVARLVRRDTSIPADRFGVFFDPYHDRRSGYYFMVNAAGVLYDGTLFNDSWDDNSWDAVWDGRARIDDQGWTAEMRIPFSQLRFARQERCIWGINFKREITRRSEMDYLVYPPKKESGFVSRFPDLAGLDGLRGGRAIELTPYVTGKAEYLAHDSGDPFHDGSNYVPGTGADLRMGVGGKLTLNATINPDFGQVEVDPAVVNLSDVESFFQEKRPFFVENSRVFNFGNEGASDYWGFNWPEPLFFYSRRIGRSPQGEVPDSAFTDVPLATHILGAAKLTGKLAPTWNFGTLHAVTAKESADLWGSGVTTSAEVEPLTYYGIARAQKEFPQGRHGLGFLSSVVARKLDDPALRDQLNQAAVQGGIDGWHFLDSKKVWVLSGWAMGSLVTGTEAQMTELQRSSRHYFQRPDAGHVSVDSSLTSMAGYGARVWLNKEKGRILSNSAIGFMNPKFDVNDMGFHTRSDVINGHIGGGYQWTDTNPWRKNAYILGAVFDSHDLDGNQVWAGVWAKGQIEFINNYSWNTSMAYNPETVNNRRTRGGPLTLNRPGYEWNMYFDTDSKQKWFYYIESYNYFTEAGSMSYSIYPGIEWKPVSSLSVSLGPAYERNIEDAQYVTTVDDATATATYAQRYVFSTLDQTTVSAKLRVNWSFTPRLSLETFLQPLVSSGDYHAFKELARPKSYDFNRYGEGGSTIDESTGTVDPDGPGPAPSFVFDNPDFDVRSLRGNAVLRWEYMPGSTLFMVWTHERSQDGSSGAFDFTRSVDQLVDADSDNVFLIKVTYYLGR